jgi:hypothetical protein
MTAGNADECSEATLAPNGADSNAIPEGALAVLKALAATAGRSKVEQISAFRAVTRYSEDHDCQVVIDKASDIVLNEFGFTRAEADQEIFLESSGDEPPSKFEREYLAEAKAAEEAWLKADRDGWAKAAAESRKETGGDNHYHSPFAGNPKNDANQIAEGKAAPQPKQFAFNPSPYAPPDPKTIPRREWLYGKYYIRGVVSATLGAPGRLKSTVGMTDAISMATGLDLMNGKEPLEGGPLRAAYINGEENQDELDRRFAAICKRYQLMREAYEGRIWIISTRDTPLRLAVIGKGGSGVIAEDAVSAVETWADTSKLDALIFDPVVSFHRVRENDPGDMDMLYKQGFGRIAGKNRAVDLAIHPRKPAPGALNTTMDDLRGTGAQEGAIRSARIFNFMTTAEAEQLGIDEDHRRLHVRIEGGKNNPGPIAKATWVKIETEDLPNGDTVAVATPWKPPNPFDGMTAAKMRECRKVVQGGAFRASAQSPDWVGYAVAKTLDIELDPKNPEHNKEGRAKVKGVLKTWFRNKVLDTEEREDRTRQKRKFVIPGKWRDDTVSTDECDSEVAAD